MSKVMFQDMKSLVTGSRLKKWMFKLQTTMTDMIYANCTFPTVHPGNHQTEKTHGRESKITKPCCWQWIKPGFSRHPHTSPRCVSVPLSWGKRRNSMRFPENLRYSSNKPQITPKCTIRALKSWKLFKQLIIIGDYKKLPSRTHYLTLFDPILRVRKETSLYPRVAGNS